MSIVRFPVRYIASVDPTSSRDCIKVELSMTEAQMYEALQAFLTRVSGETWAKWVKQIDSEVTA